MKINVHYKFLPALAAISVALSSVASFQGVYADNTAETDESHIDSVQTADDGETKNDSTQIDDSGETEEESKSDSIDKNPAEKAPPEEKNDSPIDASELEEELKSEPVKFSVQITNESEEGAYDGKIKAVIENGLEDDIFFCSFNGGKTFKKLDGRTASLVNLSEGCYSVCIMKNRDESTLSEVKTVYVSSDDSIYPVEISSESVSESIYKDGYIKVHIENRDRKKSYEASIDGGATWKDVKGKSVLFAHLESGSYVVTAREKGAKYSDSAELTVNLNKISHKKKGMIEGIPVIMQNPELPTGCEITSLTMLLNFLGFEADKLVMADKYLPKGEYRNSDFHSVFVGDPRNYNAYGCFSPAIVKAAKKYLEDMENTDEYKIRNLTGCTPDSLYSAVDKGNPVIVWATMDMKPVGKGAKWTVKDTGQKLVWYAGEHCLVLTGYDSKKVYVNDPLKGAVSYDRDEFEKRFGELLNQAVIIYKQ